MLFWLMLLAAVPNPRAMNRVVWYRAVRFDARVGNLWFLTNYV